jgi:signal transduction histidine kinase
MVNLRNRSLLLLTLLILQTSVVYAQSQQADALLKKVETSKGQDQILALNDLCKLFYATNPQQGIAYGERALSLADSLKLFKLKGKICNSLGLNYITLADYSKARGYFDEAYRTAVAFGDSSEVGTYYNRLGLLYENQGVFDSCLVVFAKSRDISLRMNDYGNAGTAAENIGTIYLLRGNLQSAIKNLLEAHALFLKTNDPKKLTYVNLKLGQIYSETNDVVTAEKYYRLAIKQALEDKDFIKAGLGLNAIAILRKKAGRHEEALTLFQEALEVIKPMNARSLTGLIYGNMANTYVLLKNYSSALTYQKRSFTLAVESKKPLSIALNENTLGYIYVELHDYKSARLHFENTIPYFMQSKSESNLIKVYQSLIRVNDSLRDFRQALKYFYLHDALKDSINRGELNTALDSIRVKFKTEQVDQENAALSQKSEMQDRTISMQRTVMIVVVVAIALLITLLVVVFRNREKIRRANDQLEQKNNEISGQAQALQVKNEQLHELSKFKDLMNSILVHDLKNPLNTIINMNPADSSRQEMEAVVQSGKKMLHLVLNLLDVSRYENNLLKIETSDVSLSQLIRDAFGEVDYMAHQRGVRLMRVFRNDFMVSVEAGMLERVFINLFTNALKFSPSGAMVEVDAHVVQSGMVRVTVRDHGEGIGPDLLPFVFEKFRKGEHQSTGSLRSTGIGLTFCKMAVEAHSGAIGVESEAGSGAIFWITLPLSQNQDGLQEVRDQDLETHDELPHLAADEKQMMAEAGKILAGLSIHQVTDVKEVICNLGFDATPNIAKWRESLLEAISDCNEIQYHALLNRLADD